MQGRSHRIISGQVATLQQPRSGASRGVWGHAPPENFWYFGCSEVSFGSIFSSRSLAQCVIDVKTSQRIVLGMPSPWDDVVREDSDAAISYARTYVVSQASRRARMPAHLIIRACAHGEKYGWLARLVRTVRWCTTLGKGRGGKYTHAQT